MSNPIVVVSDAIAARRLLTAKEDQILRGEYTYKYDRIVFGNSLVTGTNQNFVFLNVASA